MNVVSGIWHSQDLPPLNQPRMNHSSLAINNKIYVVGGGEKSIETLGMRVREDGSISFVSRKWDSWEPKHPITQLLPVIAPLSNGRSFLVFGSDQLDAFEGSRRGLVISTEAKKVEKMFEQDEFICRSYGGGQLTSDGHTLALVAGGSTPASTVMVKFDPLNNRWNTLKKFGRT